MTAPWDQMGTPSTEPLVNPVATEVKFGLHDKHVIMGKIRDHNCSMVIGLPVAMAMTLFGRSYRNVIPVEKSGHKLGVVKIPAAVTTPAQWLMESKPHGVLFEFLHTIDLFMGPEPVHSKDTRIHEVLRDLGIIPGTDSIRPMHSGWPWSLDDALDVGREVQSPSEQCLDILWLAKALFSNWPEYSIRLRVESMLRCNPVLDKLVQQQDTLVTMNDIIGGMKR